ncbi:MAG: hypothetical protein IKR59_07900 [Lachnospiraceae bacterium]|nr:hypothetical protein [Lachnospiraceae bacterium]
MKKRFAFAKKIFTVLIAFSVLLSLISGCKRAVVSEESTTVGTTAEETAAQTSTEKETTAAETSTEAETTKEETTTEKETEPKTTTETEEETTSEPETAEPETEPATEVPTEPETSAPEPSLEESTSAEPVETTTEAPSAAEEEIVWADDMRAIKCDSFSPAMNMESFDERFLQYISAHTDGSYMTSPLSFRYALGLLLAGASGETKTELLAALGVSSEEEWTNHCLNFNGFVNAYTESAAGSMTPGKALRVANSVWKRADILEDFTPAYKESVNKNYAAEYRIFTPENAVSKINEWANIKTEGLISRLLPDDYPADALAIVLMNALYFKDNWVQPFNTYATEEDDFHTESGETVKKPFMHLTERFRYYEDGDTQLVILPMESGVYMAFVLGSTANLSTKINAAEGTRVRLSIPKMDLETSFGSGELVDFLKECGVSRAFNQSLADFSAMIDHSIYVDEIIQKTRIKLDEDGVEAAAVTAIMTKDGMSLDTKEPVDFTADRPFSFYIYTTANTTTSILFAGEIVK